jgi:D-glycero-D-manno-heptose 1,7-bisphosphate phosphatase
MNCKKIKNKACFLDRDGVLIKEINYLSSPDQVNVYPETIQALRLLKENNYVIIVVTNQAGVARGFFAENSVPKVHNEIDRQLKQFNLQIDHYYYCPHHPDGSVEKYAINCDCRKPMPGMILQAAKEYNLDLNASFLIGDKISDLLSAENAGCLGILVETGYGQKNKKEAIAKGFSVFSNIEQAVLSLLNKNLTN